MFWIADLWNRSRARGFNEHFGAFGPHRSAGDADPECGARDGAADFDRSGMHLGAE